MLLVLISFAISALRPQPARTYIPAPCHAVPCYACAVQCCAWLDLQPPSMHVPCAALHPLEKTGRWETDWHAREDMPEVGCRRFVLLFCLKEGQLQHGCLV